MPDAADERSLPQVIPVIDLLAGRAVRASRGRRDEYRPIESVLLSGSDPIELAEVLIWTWGCPEIYVADLDALQGGLPQSALLHRLSNLPASWTIDVGVRSADDAKALRNACPGTKVSIVLATETLPHADAIAACVAAWGDRGRATIGLDWLRQRFRTARGIGVEDPDAWISAALDAGIESAIALDLDRVGSDGGFAWPGDVATSPLFRRFRRRISGGGIRSEDDLRAAGDAGCDAVLVGSALHDGRIDPRTLGSRWAIDR